MRGSYCHSDTGGGDPSSLKGVWVSWSLESMVMLAGGTEAQTSLAEHSRPAFFQTGVFPEPGRTDIWGWYI